MSERFEIKRMGVVLTPSYRECMKALKDMYVPVWKTDKNTYTGFEGEVFESNLPMQIGIGHAGSRVNMIELMRPEGYYTSAQVVDASYKDIQNELVKEYSQPDFKNEYSFDDATTIMASRWETPELIIDHVATKGDNLSEYVHIFFRSNLNRKKRVPIIDFIIPITGGLLLTFLLRIFLWQRTGYAWQLYVLYIFSGLVFGLLLFFALFHEKNPRFRQFLYRKRDELEVDYEAEFPEPFLKKYNGYMFMGKHFLDKAMPLTIYFFQNHILFVSLHNKDIIELDRPFSDAGCLLAEGNNMTAIFANKEFVAFVLENSDEILDLLKEYQDGKRRNAKDGIRV